MSCNYCGTQHCQCILGQNVGMAQGQNWTGAQQSAIANQQASQSLVWAAQQNAYSQMSSGYLDQEIKDFLTIIENKSDEEIGKFYIEEECKALVRYKNELAAKRTKFLTQCGKYRPTITAHLLERFANLKAFI